MPRRRLMSATSLPITRQARPDPTTHTDEERAMVNAVAPLPAEPVSPTGDGPGCSQAPHSGGFAGVLEHVAHESQAETASARPAAAEGARDGGKQASDDNGAA